MNNLGIIHEGIIASSPMIGGMGADLPVRVPSGDHEPFLPEFERQAKLGLETMNCVQFSFLNVLEAVARFFGKTLNLSDRFMYWASGCTARGNTYGACYYGFLKYGCTKETLWAWLVEMSRDVYGMEPPDDIKAEALKIFDVLTVGQLHYVPNTIEGFKEALTKAPLWFCNEGHSMVMYRVDDRIRFFDTYPGATGDGKSSFPLDYASKIVAAYIIPVDFKKQEPPTPMPTLKLPDNCYVTGIFPHEQRVALHLGGKLMMGAPAASGATPEQAELARLRSDVLVDRLWKARNEDPTTHTFKEGPMRTISEQDWNSFPHVDFKGNPI